MKNSKYHQFQTATELELRQLLLPELRSQKDLSDFLKVLQSRPHDYGTAAICTGIAAAAAHNFMARTLGLTGFQASCADLHFIQRSRNVERVHITDLDDFLYPQYNPYARLETAYKNALPELKKKAKQLLKQKNYAHPDVVAHWKKIANLDL